MTADLAVRMTSIREWVDRRSVRERVFVLAAVLAVLWACWNLLLTEPLDARRSALAADELRLTDEIRELEVRGAEIVALHGSDPNALLLARVGSLEQQIHHLKERIRERTVTMISPPEMARLLEELLARDSELQLVRLENLGREPLNAQAEAAGGASPPVNVYKHTFEVVLEGRYLSTLRYLRALEDLPWNFFWENLAYEVRDHPNGLATIRAYTLSADEGWLGA